MKARPLASSILAFALLTSSPHRAHADETPTTTLMLEGGQRVPDVLALTTKALAVRPAPSLDPFTKQPTDIRLSRGAKTAIIVTAIVVGVLVIAGAIVIAKPHPP